MTPELLSLVLDKMPISRLGTPDDRANLVGLLCSPEGGWVNGQLLQSNGGFGVT
jgi:3-oxoacyl-[acyl-carrier protein] reductase